MTTTTRRLGSITEFRAVLRVMTGLSAEETAKAVGSTPCAVRIAQDRASGRLGNVLASQDLG